MKEDLRILPMTILAIWSRISSAVALRQLDACGLSGGNSWIGNVRIVAFVSSG